MFLDFGRSDCQLRFEALRVCQKPSPCPPLPPAKQPLCPAGAELLGSPGAAPLQRPPYLAAPHFKILLGRKILVMNPKATACKCRRFSYYRANYAAWDRAVV